MEKRGVRKAGGRGASTQALYASQVSSARREVLKCNEESRTAVTQIAIRQHETIRLRLLTTEGRAKVPK
eukprot:COSAG02_NODE_1731_length_11173_cov_6.039281_5_plen_69_part_00